MFVNAVEEFETHPEVRRLNTLAPNNIDKIAKAYKGLRDVSGFAKIVDLKQIRENDYNLNVSLYAPLIEKEEKINIKEVSEDLEKLREQRENSERRIREHLEEIMKVL